MGCPSYTDGPPSATSAVDTTSVVNPAHFYAKCTPTELRYLRWRALGVGSPWEFFGRPIPYELVRVWRASGLVPYREANRNDIDDSRHLLCWAPFVDLSDEPAVTILAWLPRDAQRAFAARALGPIHPSFDPNFVWTTVLENQWAACRFAHYQDPDPMGLELDRADRLLRRYGS